MGGLLDNNRPKWLEYVKQGRKDKVQIQDMATHIGVAKNTLKSWLKKWKTEGLIEGKVDWEQYREYLITNAPHMTVEAMAKVINQPAHSIYKRMERWNIDRRGYVGGENPHKDWIIANRSTKTLKQIGEHIKVAETTVGRWLKEWKADGSISKKRVYPKSDRPRKVRTYKPKEKKTKELKPKIISNKIEMRRPPKPPVKELPNRIETREMKTVVIPGIVPKTCIQIPLNADSDAMIQKWRSRHNKY
jgi:transposase